MTTVKSAASVALVPLLVIGALQVLRANPFVASDPGVRGGPAGVGDQVDGLTPAQDAFFAHGRVEFEETDGTDEGLGPRFNLDSCLGCHAQPVSGGTSPFVNPQVAVANALGATNDVPSFITAAGPVREARFKFNPNGTPDGGVHALFVTTGRSDAPGCNAVQENFEAQVANHNVIFRIPTPTFGAGLIEAIPDAAIEANRASSSFLKLLFGISGRANHNGNDGTIARFGWKAQNKSLLLFSGEAYNVEMGITNELFQDERDGNPKCQFTTSPNSVTNFEAGTNAEVVSAIEAFGFFMRFLAPPIPSTTSPGGPASIAAGRLTFTNAGCALCHTPALMTGDTTVTALANKQANLFSDLLIHNMGPGLADQVSQGQARGDEFRTAPLWGLGKRIFFLHDGRTTDLIQAIRAHRSGGNSQFGPSEANVSVDVFNGLSESSKQNLLNFLRSL
jgi:CxxC motif-containing protein (DUF1111 family)